MAGVTAEHWKQGAFVQVATFLGWHGTGAWRPTLPVARARGGAHWRVRGPPTTTPRPLENQVVTTSPSRGIEKCPSGDRPPDDEARQALSPCASNLSFRPAGGCGAGPARGNSAHLPKLSERFGRTARPPRGALDRHDVAVHSRSGGCPLPCAQAVPFGRRRSRRSWPPSTLAGAAAPTNPSASWMSPPPARGIQIRCRLLAAAVTVLRVDGLDRPPDTLVEIDASAEVPAPCGRARHWWSQLRVGHRGPCAAPARSEGSAPARAGPRLRPCECADT